jgi:hypothetical protein
MADESGITIGELKRLNDRSFAEHGVINSRIDRVQAEFTRKETFDMMVGSFRVEITGMRNDIVEMNETIRQMKEQGEARARALLALTVSAFIGPIVTALIVFWLTKGGPR